MIGRAGPGARCAFRFCAASVRCCDDPEMRHVRAFTLLTVVVALLSVCGWTAATSGATAASGAVARLGGGFVVTPTGIVDPSCDGGNGVRLPGSFGGNSVVVSGSMADGSTLIAVTKVFPATRSIVLRSVTSGCALNHGFGADGAATIVIPAGLRAPKPENADAEVSAFPAHGIWVNVVAPRRGGGALVAGVYDGDMVAGELTVSGTMDQTFGTHGWAVLPFGGEVTRILQEPSGRIVLAGDNGGGGCCGVNWVAALSASGQFEQTFGTRGRAKLPTGEDSGVETLALEPNGDILAAVGWLHMGAGAFELAMLTPSGQPEPLFAKRLQAFWHAHSFDVFVGDVYVDDDGFTLVGTGQNDPLAGPSYTAPSAMGLIAHFRTNGTPSGPAVRFPSRMYGGVQGFPEGDDTVVVGEPYADSTRIALTALRRDGSTDPRFASDGRALIRTPWRGLNAAFGTSVLIAEASPAEIVIIATNDDAGDELQLIRVHL
jgi:hypothetical protein